MFSDDVGVHIGRRNTVARREPPSKPGRIEGSPRAYYPVSGKAGPFRYSISQSINWIRCQKEDTAWFLATNVAYEIVHDRSSLTEALYSGSLARLADSRRDNRYIRRTTVREVARENASGMRKDFRI